MMLQYSLLPFKTNEIVNIDTKLMEIFEQTREISEKFPETARAIEFNLDRCGLQKKQLRSSVIHYNDLKRNGCNYLFDSHGI